MPDHLHALIAAESEQADLGVFVKRFKQMRGLMWRSPSGLPWLDYPRDMIIIGDGVTA